MATYRRRNSVLGLLPSLGLVAVLAAASTWLWPLSQVRYIGATTARVKIESTLAGLVFKETYHDTKLTPLLEKYLGPLPEESEWIYMNDEGLGPLGIKGSGWGEDVYMNSNWLAVFIDPTHANLPASFTYDMTDAARRVVLENYVESVKLSTRDDVLCGSYVFFFVEAVGYLDRPALPQDIPPLAEVRDGKLWESKWQAKVDKLCEAWVATHMPAPKRKP
jgi:hypothetical protein